MSEVVQTLEGWYVAHDVRTIDWKAWRQLSSVSRAQMIAEWIAYEQSAEQRTVDRSGGHGLYLMAGAKADLMWIELRPTLEELEAAKMSFNKCRFADFTRREYSYVSVVELSAYLAKPGVDVDTDPYLQGRLKPTLPTTTNVCFYPMNKRRLGADNWYMLPLEQRRDLMRSHGLIGRSYAGKVTQIITGSTGLDDWEWGVTLYADDPLQFKKLVYEMRFDEASARFAEFGPFYLGSRLDSSKCQELMNI